MALPSVTSYHFLITRRLKPRPPDIYFFQKNAKAHNAALQLRDAVLRLRRDGAFVAVPLFRVNESPIGPHPVGKPLPLFSLSLTRLIPVKQDRMKSGAPRNPSRLSSLIYANTGES